MTEEAAQADYPHGYRACRVCRVPLGQKCRSQSGRIVNGRPDGKTIELDHPHNARQQRKKRVR